MAAQKWTPKNSLSFAGKSFFFLQQGFLSAACFTHSCFSRNGLDEAKAMDLSAALHKVSILSRPRCRVLFAIQHILQAAFIFHFQSSPSEILRSTLFLKPLEVVAKVLKTKHATIQI